MNVNRIARLVGLAWSIAFLFAGSAHAAKTLAVPSVSQLPQNNWCWAATSEAVLRYTQNAPGLCNIANYGRAQNGWGNDDCCTNPTGAICNQPNLMYGSAGSLQSILTNWGADSEASRALPLSSVTDNIDDDAPMIVRWAWTAGGGHFVVLHGYSGSTMTVMDPYSGPTAMSYSSLRSTPDRKWTHTLTVRPLKITYVVDDTGSMYDDIDAVRNTLLTQISGYSSAGRFVKYTLITYKDSVAFVGSTTDSSAITGWVNALSATGGDDCAEEGYGALDEAAERAPGSQIWWMTDADSHGGSLRMLLTKARLLLAKCTLHSTILGACTEPASMLSQDGSRSIDRDTIKASRASVTADVSAITAGEELSTATGGLFFSANVGDIDDVTAIVTEEMDSSAFLARRAYPAGSFVTSVPVDTSVETLKITLDISAGSTGNLSVERPGGAVLAPGDAGVTEIIAGESRMLIVKAPALAAGTFRVTSASTGASFLSVSGSSPHSMELLSDATSGAGVPFAVRLSIPSLAPPTGPAGPGPGGPGGPLPSYVPGPSNFPYDRAALKFYLEAEDGSGRQEKVFHDDGLHDDGDPLDGVFGGELTLPDAGRYRIVAAIAGASFERVATIVIATADVSIAGPADNVARPGTTVNRTFTITNLGSTAKTFALGISSTPAWADAGAVPTTILLGAGASGNIVIPVHVPADAVRGDATVLGVTVAASDRPDVTDSAFATTEVWSGPVLQTAGAMPTHPGGLLILSGSGFGADPGVTNRSTDASHVLLSGTRVPNANVTSWSDSEIRITVPSSATSGLLHVVAASEESNAVSVTIVPNVVALTISKSAPASAASGSLLTYVLTYGNTGTTGANAVVIRDTLPAGTAFVSASSGGTFAAGVVTWNVGNVPAATTGLTVSFTVQVTASEGGAVTNNTYSIEADSVAPVSGAPVITSVAAAAAADIPTATEAVLAALATILALAGALVLGKRTA